jgi:hypothetical protein
VWAADGTPGANTPRHTREQEAVMRTNLRRAGAVLAALMLAACAGNQAENGSGGDDEGEVLRVVVENDGTIPTQVRISLVQTGGAENVVGTMSTLGRETLTARAPDFGGTYQLRATGGTNYTLTSPRVQLRGNETVTWNMRRNVIQVTR